MKPVIEHIGHAGFVVSGAHGKLLIDPWFYPALLESWFPWPDNRHLMQHADGNWVYVSHHHEDHFDEKFLTSQFGDGRGINLIVPKFRSRRMERLWQRVAPRAVRHVLGHGEQLMIGPGVTVTMLLDRSHKEDSALLVDHCGYRFLDMNDCELNLADIPQADEIAAQFSGAFWYPQCYDFDRMTYVRKAAGVRQNNLERMYRRFEKSDAAVYRPSAGPAAFLDPPLQRFNSGEIDGDIFPDWHDVQRGFLRRFPHAGIGQYLPVTETIQAYARRREDEIEQYYQRPTDLPSIGQVTEHFRQLHQKNKNLLRNYGKDVVFSSVHEEWKVRISTLSHHLEDSFDPSYWIRVPRRVMHAVVNKHCTWETVLSSMRCELSREPDEYDFTLMSLLTFGDEPAITNEIAKNRDRPAELIEVNGYEFQRYCPHAGEDLAGVSVTRDGKITCPRHGWCWDLTTGKCTGGDKNVTMRTRRLP